MLQHLILGNIVTSESPSHSFSQRDLVNVIFSGFLSALIMFLTSSLTGIESLNLGNYGWIVPFLAVLMKTTVSFLSDYQKEL